MREYFGRPDDGPAWLERWLREPDVMLREKDPIALGLHERFGGVRMPNLRLNDVDIAALIDFMHRRSREVFDSRSPRATPVTHAEKSTRSGAAAR